MVLKFVSATRFLVIIPIIGLALTASVLLVRQVDVAQSSRA
jgi:hypothetical protein